MQKETRKPKYTITAIVICILALLTGKPVSELLIPEEQSATQETVVSEQITASEEINSEEATVTDYTFRSKDQLEDHYQKHGIEMGFKSAEEYQQAANRVISNPDTLHKLEAEDGDDVYFLERTNEFVIVSKAGYIRTYFYPSDGIDYFNRQ